MSEAERIAEILERSVGLSRRVFAEHAATMLRMVDVMTASIQAGGKVFFCGNGGSAAAAQHLATQLLVHTRGASDRPALPGIALTFDAAVMSAAGNDFGFDMVFARPLSGLGRKGDVLVGLTTSGRSPNVVRALEVAQAMGIARLGLLGGLGRPAAGLCELAIVVPSSESARVQEAHMIVGHALLEMLEDRLAEEA